MLKGDFKKLGQLAENLRKLAEVPAHVAPVVAKELKALTEAQFDAGVNPYGRPWAPLAFSTLLKGRTPPVLTDFGHMRKSLSFFPLPGEGVGATIDFPGPVHQFGAPSKKLPARQIFPTGSFPRTWRTAIEDASRKAIHDVLYRGVA